MLKFGNIILTNNTNWLNIPEHNVITSGNHGTVTASPNKGIQGTEVTLSNSPESGYEFSSYSVTGAELYDGNKLTIGTTDVSVVGTFASVGGYCLMNVTAITPSGALGPYYVSIPDQHSTPFTLPNSYTMSVNRYQNAHIMNYNGPDNVTNLTIRQQEDEAKECVIGNNTFNSVTAITWPSNSTHLPLSIGDNSLNNFEGDLNRRYWNVDFVTPIYIGNNSCAKMDLTLSNNDILILGTNSLKHLWIEKAFGYVYLPSGNIGADLTETPIIMYRGCEHNRFYGDVKTCMLQSALARGATVNNSGDLYSVGYVITYMGGNTHAEYEIRCPDASDADITWLNWNRNYFITGNSYASMVTFYK